MPAFLQSSRRRGRQAVWATVSLAAGLATLTAAPSALAQPEGNKTYGCSRPPQSEINEAWALVDAVESRLQGVYVGWQIAVAKNCRPTAAAAGGLADVETQEAMTISHRLPIGSVAKLVTATAVMHELEFMGISANTSINGYLDMFWDFDNVGYKANVSWAEMMNQTSGIDSGSTSTKLSYGEISEFLPTAQEASPYLYDNANAGLLKFLYTGLVFTIALGLGDSEAVEYAAAKYYELLVNMDLFNQIGIDASCWGREMGPPVAKVYKGANSDGAIVSMANGMEACSAGGWYLSSMELLEFAVSLRHTDKFVSQATLTEMDQKRLGWENSPGGKPALTKNFGKIRWKGGTLKGQTCLLDFRDGTEVAIITNSNGEDAWWLCDMVVEEFDKL